MPLQLSGRAKEIEFFSSVFILIKFRFGHSMMPTQVPSRDRNRRTNRNIDLHQIFNNVSMFETEDDLMDDLIRGQCGEPAAAWDPAFNEDFVNRLHDEELDLPALNINRGRDHGLPGYNRYREICKSRGLGSRITGFGRANSFGDLGRGGFLTKVGFIDLRLIFTLLWLVRHPESAVSLRACGRR